MISMTIAKFCFILQDMFKPSKYLADNLKSLGGGGAQFLIVLFSTPVMTRLYDPSAYATFGLINSSATVFVSIGMLSLPYAYPTVQRSADRARLMQCMLWMLVGLTLLSVMVALIIRITDMRHVGMDISETALLFFPLLVLTGAARQIMLMVAVERAHFNSTSLGQIIEPICSRGGAIALGSVAGGHPAFVLASMVFGYVVTTVSVGLLVVDKGMRHWIATIHSRKQFFSTLRRYKNFIFYSTPTQQLFPLTTLGVQMMVALFFSSEQTGHFILASSILTLPVTLIALTTAPVVYRRLIEIERKTPEKLLEHIVMLSVLYLIGGIGLVTPIFLFGESIFTFIFGANWTEAGAIAEILSVAYFFAFAAVGLQSIFRIIRHQGTELMLEIVSCSIIGLVAVLCFVTMNFYQALLCLSCAWLLRNLILLSSGLLLTRRYIKNLTA